jgi:hypothetical protein
MLVLVAAIVAVGCIGACLRRLRFAGAPTYFHPAVLRAELASKGMERLRRVIAATPRADWERALLGALDEPNPELRAGLVNEQLSELDFRLTRWERVPRVCASIASSAGFLCGSLVLRNGLAAASGTDELGSDVVNAIVVQAVNVAALGVAGAAFAIAAHVRSKKVARAFEQQADALVDALAK